ncbi:DsbA family protein [Thermoactinomyces sp. DSM 45892]|uniref:DsbA family protein n=1 Tax=Thermoactinomyces sp. DSM 45892 TaxID=1882753 RepID=UPI00089A7EE0|nr:DsbA family protein [Thermoactinomyces sp. DSM 45892]SDZ23831.1 Protein-disulfide isomerase [Thermoactinomyces sp. DSM 45892]
MKKKKNQKGHKKGQISYKPLVIGTLITLALVVGIFVLADMRNKENLEAIRKEQPNIVNQPVLGKEDAPVTIVEFGDYKCPSCKAWSQKIFPQLKKDYIDTGKVKLAYIHVLFHGEESTLSSLAAESVFAQNPQAFWKYNKALFDAQPNGNHDGLWVTQEKLLDLAKTHTPEIDLTKLENDIKEKKASNQVSVDADLVQQFKVEQTPTIMINGIELDNPFDYEKVQSIIDKELNKKK